MAEKLKALTNIYHTAEQKEYPAGAMVDVSHLSDEQIAMLIAQGVFAGEGEAVVSDEGVGVETAAGFDDGEQN